MKYGRKLEASQMLKIEEELRAAKEAIQKLSNRVGDGIIDSDDDDSLLSDDDPLETA